MISIGIDPSINTCGWAIVSSKRGLIKCGLILGDSKRDWTCAAFNMAVKVAEVCPHAGGRITIELPQTWSSSRGIPAKMGGAIQKLYFLVGAIYVRLGGACHLVPVSKWKGNVPKKVTYHRMKSKYGFKFPPNDKNFNVSDAIGLADYGLTLNDYDFAPVFAQLSVSHVK